MNYQVINSTFETFLLNIQEVFQQEESITLFDKRNIIKVVEHQNEKYVIKSFKIPHLLNRVIYKFFRASKAQRSYENSMKLLNLNINTPKPIGYIEFDSLLLFNESYYISHFFDYDFEIRAVFKDKNFTNRNTILKKFVEYTYDLHNKGVYHIDYSPGNILIKKVDQEYIFYIIDVNRMKFMEFDINLRMKSMAKLTSSEEDNSLIVEYYSSISNIDKTTLMQRLNFHLDEQKKYLTNKKRLKKLKKF